MRHTKPLLSFIPDPTPIGYCYYSITADEERRNLATLYRERPHKHSDLIGAGVVVTERIAPMSLAVDNLCRLIRSLESYTGVSL